MLKVSLLGFKRNFSPSSLRLSSIPVLGSVQQRLPEPLWPSMALERASSTSLSTSGAPARRTLKIRTGVARHYARCAPALLLFTGIFKPYSCFSRRQYTFACHRVSISCTDPLNHLHLATLMKTRESHRAKTPSVFESKGNKERK